eukprot:CAMPEP_0177792132 /NCGR_PEP_ID=MMETSP0491_2-20121128/24355_1 /TAXON_ID=63592 /ORGANISM="Tetraselmis chuii, Strain PLY429" /LENGTH=32 /DNA_ID= /DNA_START= /DNA_END= /DNA_ORIENTATION=
MELDNAALRHVDRTEQHTRGGVHPEQPHREVA